MVADQRKPIATLICPNYEQLCRWPRERGQETLADLPAVELAQCSEVCDALPSRIESLQVCLAGFEKVKYTVLLAGSFTIKAGTLAPTLKLKCGAILKQCAELIEKLRL